LALAILAIRWLRPETSVWSCPHSSVCLLESGAVGMRSPMTRERPELVRPR